MKRSANKRLRIVTTPFCFIEEQEVDRFTHKVMYTRVILTIRIVRITQQVCVPGVRWTIVAQSMLVVVRSCTPLFLGEFSLRVRA